MIQYHTPAGVVIVMDELKNILDEKTFPESQLVLVVDRTGWTLDDTQFVENPLAKACAIALHRGMSMPYLAKRTWFATTPVWDVRDFFFELRQHVRLGELRAQPTILIFHPSVARDFRDHWRDQLVREISRIPVASGLTVSVALPQTP